jgi:ketosteroid isomerase-like protein
MAESPLEIARRGLAAWQEGDLATVESILDPSVQWAWYEPGDWYCKDRNDVMQAIRERFEQGFARGAIEYIEGDTDTVVVVAHPREIGGGDWPEEAATVLTFTDGLVTKMRDYRTKDEALAAIS